MPRVGIEPDEMLRWLSDARKTQTAPKDDRKKPAKEEKRPPKEGKKACKCGSTWEESYMCCGKEFGVRKESPCNSCGCIVFEIVPERCLFPDSRSSFEREVCHRCRKLTNSHGFA